MSLKYTKKERMEIGRRVYEKEITVRQAAVIYDVSFYTAREYFRMYKATLEVKDLEIKEITSNNVN